MACPDPHLFVCHLQDRLAAVAADALRLSLAHHHALPAAFGDAVAIAAEVLRGWEQEQRQARAELEYGPMPPAASGGCCVPAPSHQRRRP